MDGPSPETRGYRVLTRKHIKRQLSKIMKALLDQGNWEQVFIDYFIVDEIAVSDPNWPGLGKLFLLLEDHRLCGTYKPVELYTN